MARWHYDRHFLAVLPKLLPAGRSSRAHMGLRSTIRGVSARFVDVASLPCSSVISLFLLTMEPPSDENDSGVRVRQIGMRLLNTTLPRTEDDQHIAAFDEATADYPE